MKELCLGGERWWQTGEIMQIELLADNYMLI